MPYVVDFKMTNPIWQEGDRTNTTLHLPSFMGNKKGDGHTQN